MPVTELVEVRQKDCNGKPDPPAGGHAQKQFLTRYQHPNHQGSTTLETNEKGDVITYEEYHPFGTTSYQATNGSITAAAKRYRYTGMERDDETGLEYHNARYYIPWLGRWMNPDPIGIGDGVNVYAYCHGDPIGNTDTGGTQTYVNGATYKNISQPPAQTLPKEQAPLQDNLKGVIPVPPSLAKLASDKKADDLEKSNTVAKGNNQKVGQQSREYLVYQKYKQEIEKGDEHISSEAQRRMYHELHGPDLSVDIYYFLGHVSTLYVPQGRGLKGSNSNNLATNSGVKQFYSNAPRSQYKFEKRVIFTKPTSEKELMVLLILTILY